MTGWTFAEIGEMTLPQVIAKLNKGETPAVKIAGPSAIRAVLQRFKAGEFADG